MGDRDQTKKREKDKSRAGVVCGTKNKTKDSSMLTSMEKQRPAFGSPKKGARQDNTGSVTGTGSATGSGLSDGELSG